MSDDYAAPASPGRPPAWWEWLALGAGLAVFGYLGWDEALWDARLQLLLHLIAIGAIAGLGVMALRRTPLPRTPLDLPILGLLAAFALATVSAINVGMSLRAMAALVAFAAMLPVAVLAVRHRPTWVGLVTSVPVLLLSIPALWELVGRRIEWIAVGAPGLPPLRLESEDTAFGSVAVPPFVLIPAWALAGLIEPRWLRLAVRISLVAVGVPLIILSGSRSAWLAIAVGLAIGVLPWAWRQGHGARWPRRLTVRGVVLAAGAVAVGVVGVVIVLPRLTAVTSLLYRGALWRDTLVAWSSDPILGIGPGFMPYARLAAAADGSFPARQPHSHNLVLGVLGDAGILGLVAGVIVVGTLVLVARPGRCRTSIGRTASVVLVGLGIGGLFEDITFLPGFNLLVLTLLAVVLLDARAVSWAPMRVMSRLQRPALLAGMTSIATVLVGAMVVADAGAIAYRAGIEQAEEGNPSESAAWLARAVQIDRWHPAGPRALAVAADAADQPDVARDAAREAVTLNPGDATGWLNLAMLCEADGDAECARSSVERASATARYLGTELVNAAVLLERLDETEAADEAFRRALLTQPSTSFVVEWPRSIVIGDGTIPEVTDASWQLNLLLARRANGEAIDPAAFPDPAVRALAHGVKGERDEAEILLARALDERPDDVRTHDINVILRDAWGQPIDDATRIASTVRGRAFPERDLQVGIPRSVRDVASFRTYPRDGFVTAAVRLATRPPFPWTLQRVLP